jgi:hypothetical protein
MQVWCVSLGLGFWMPQYRPPLIAELIAVASSLGIPSETRRVRSDRVVGMRDFRFSFNIFVPLLVAAAGSTERLRVGTLVLNAPFWNSALLAREVATTDILVDGRLELSLGADHMKWEFCSSERSRRWLSSLSPPGTLWILLYHRPRSVHGGLRAHHRAANRELRLAYPPGDTGGVLGAAARINGG